MPKMSDHMEEGKLIRWLVAEGTQVAVRQPILEIETDKAVGEVEAPADGILAGIQAKDDAVVPVGAVVAFILKPGEKVPDSTPIIAPKGAVAPTETPAAPAAVTATEPGAILAAPAARRVAAELGVDLFKVKGTGPGGRVKEEDVRAFAEQQKKEPPPPEPAKETRILASPVARKMAEERGIDLSKINGTGPGGRITHEDVMAYAEAAAKTAAPSPAAPVPAPAASESGFEWVELSTIRRITGERMTASKQTVPHFTLTVEADMAKAALLREVIADRVTAESGSKLSYTALLVKAAAEALKKHPMANAEFSGGRIKVYKGIHVGVAVGVEGGLVVPVIHDADKKSLGEINRQLKAFQEKSSTLKFAPAELSGGTFTITNLGMFGIDQFSAIINAPQSAILAVGRIANKPVAIGEDSVAIKPMMVLSLSVDHRVLDGVTGANFLTEVKSLIENPYWLA
jgi:pyruvate dehydrogenase E2 component (dihydrolipoamide acetyltransferase)